MSLNELILERLNIEDFSPDFLGAILYDFAKIVKEEITQKFFREKAAKAMVISSFLDRVFLEFG
jgi:hypothetical protein